MTQRARYTVADVRKRAQRHTANLYDTVFTRRVSAWITAGLARLGVSPNTVSLANFIVGITACVLIGFAPNSIGVLVGIMLVHLYAVLDSVDGELARLLDKRSLKGMFLEDWSAYCMMTAFPLGVALYLQGRSAFASATMLLAVTYAVLGRNVMPALRRAIAQSPPSPVVAATASKPTSRIAGWKRVVEDHLLHHTNIRLVMTSLLLVHVATGDLIFLLELTFLGYMVALFMREGGILFLALRGDLVLREAQRLKGQSIPSGNIPL
jgi:phosphatidylglycerophosphate synthase